MKRLTPEDVKKIAAQAAIKIEPCDLEMTVCRLNDRLFSEIPLQIASLTHLPEECIPLRDDEVLPGLSRNDVLSSCPDHGDTCFQLPRVVEEDK